VPLEGAGCDAVVPGKVKGRDFRDRSFDPNGSKGRKSGEAMRAAISVKVSLRPPFRQNPAPFPVTPVPTPNPRQPDCATSLSSGLNSRRWTSLLYPHQIRAKATAQPSGFANAAPLIASNRPSDCLPGSRKRRVAPPRQGRYTTKCLLPVFIPVYLEFRTAFLDSRHALISTSVSICTYPGHVV